MNQSPRRRALRSVSRFSLFSVRRIPNSRFPISLLPFHSRVTKPPHRIPVSRRQEAGDAHEPVLHCPGVGLFVVTPGNTSGFEQFFIKDHPRDRWCDAHRGPDPGYHALGRGRQRFRLSDRDADGGKEIHRGHRGTQDVDRCGQTLENVAGVSEVLHGPVIIRSSFKSESVQAYGINIDDQISVSDLASQIVQGNLDDFRGKPTGTLLGKEMADRLQLAVGDSFILEAAGESRRYRVSALYETGVSDIDRVRIYLGMGEARSLLKKPPAPRTSRSTCSTRIRRRKTPRIYRPCSNTGPPAGRNASRRGLRSSAPCASPRRSPSRFSPSSPASRCSTRLR